MCRPSLIAWKFLTVCDAWRKAEEYGTKIYTLLTQVRYRCCCSAPHFHCSDGISPKAKAEKTAGCYLI